MFRLDKVDVKLKNANTRIENHGEELKLAIDLTFIATLPNTSMDMFGQSLRSKFFRKLTEEERGEDLAEQGADDSHMPKLIHPEITGFPWNYKGAGYRMVIAQGALCVDEIVLIDTSIHDFSFVLKDGGIVELVFKLSALSPEEETGRLCALQKRDVCLTLEPPSAEDRAQMEIDAMKEDLSPAA